MINKMIKKNKIMRKLPAFPTAYTIVFLVIIFVAALTWIMPTGSYDYRVAGTDKIIHAEQVLNHEENNETLLPIPNSYTKLPANPQGVLSIVEAPIEGFYRSMEIILFVLVIGGFLGIVMETGAIDAGIIRVIRKLEGKEGIMIAILMCIFALGGITFGMWEETIAFYPVLIPVMLIAGYDSVVAFLILVLGSQTGCMAALVSPFSTGIASRFIDVGIGEGMGFRIVMLVTMLIINTVIVLLYAAKVKKNPELSLVADRREELEKHYLHGVEKGKLPEFDGKRKVVVILFLLTFGIYIYGMLPFDSFGITVLPTLDWGLLEATALFGVAGIIVGVLYGMKEKEVVGNFISGACDLLGVAVIVGIARGITIIMKHGLILDTILHWSSLAIKGVPSVICINVIYLVHVALSFLVPSTSGLATISMPIMGPLATLKAIPKDLVVTAYMAASGLAYLITPTTAILMGGLVLARLPYVRYFKFIVPKLFILLLVSMLLLSLGLIF